MNQDGQLLAEPAVESSQASATLPCTLPDASKEVEMASMAWPKTVPDWESAGACYVDVEQLRVSALCFYFRDVLGDTCQACLSMCADELLVWLQASRSSAWV